MAFGLTPPPQPSVPDIAQYVGIAKQQLDPGFSDVVTASQKMGETTTATDKLLADQQKEQITTVQKTYADLAKEFKISQDIETGQAKKTGEENIGAAEVAMAKSGVDPSAQGFFAAPKAAAQESLQNTIADISNKYGAKQEEIANTLTSTVLQLNQKAEQYLQQGNEAMATAVAKVAELKYEHDKQITSLAQQMQSAQTKYEQDMWKDYMDEVRAQQAQATADRMAASLAITAQKAAASMRTPFMVKNPSIPGPTRSGAPIVSGGLSFFDKKGTPINPTTYAKQTGQSITSILSKSDDPTDIEFIKSYTNAQKQVATGKATTSEASAALKAAYPNIVGNENLF